ncbi:MAG: hypothetical protein ACI9D0_001794 [Bacteroidia bacterium]|jgi:hypothetical protein
MNLSILRIILGLTSLTFLSFNSTNGDFEEPNCAGCKVGIPLLEASHLKSTGEFLTLTVESKAGDCFSAFNPPALWICHPEGCNFEISRSWSSMPSGTPIETCWGWENPRSGVQLTRNCDKSTPGPVVDVNGNGSSFTTEKARCQDKGYFWELKIGDMSVEVGTVCTSCIKVGD